MLNPFARLAGQQFQMPPDMNDYTQNQGVNPMSALGASADATGADVGPQQSKLSGLSFPTPMLDKYAQTLNNPPNPKDYEPSFGRKLLGSIAGMGAGASPAGISDGQPIGFRYDPKMAGLAHDQIVDEPYDRAMGKFSQLAKIQGEGANVEEKSIANKRGLAVADARNEIAQDRIKILQQQADTAKQKEADIKVDHEKRAIEKEREFDTKLAETKREYEGKMNNFQDRLALQEKIGELNNAKSAAILAETNRYHTDLMAHRNTVDAQRDEIIKQGAQKLTDLEKKLKDAETPVETTKTVKGKPGWFGSSFGGTPDVVTTTRKGMVNPGSLNQPPSNTPPPINQRIVGQTKWQMPNGKIGIWSADGWVAQ